MTRAPLLAIVLLLAPLAALAQTSPDETNAHSAIIDGKHVQPRAQGKPATSPEATLQLLKQTPPEPPKADMPRDLYGNPIGGEPGLNPPGLAPAVPKKP